MKSIEIDDDLYAFIASQTKHIGESASQILRRLLLPEDGAVSNGNNVSEVAPNVTQAPATKHETLAPKASQAAQKVTPTNNGKSAISHATKKSTTKKVASAKSTAVSGNNTLAQPAEQHDKRDILDLVSKDALATFTKRVDQFLFVLSAAHKLNAENFEKVEEIKGKNRTYFATSKEALLENGSSTNPKLIPESPFWVVTNNNTAKKISMLEQVLRHLGYQPNVIETAVARFSSEGK
ncbi:replication initiation negative regulator SeqA [Alteromonas sp. D210916BOD_24]|uniref:replication initiation negative regulator SeqA n=1 Tax=Alteromonas sp. D210916BOD_24 TaxID=3157618 RepID=UPI00399CEC13